MAADSSGGPTKSSNAAAGAGAGAFHFRFLIPIIVSLVALPALLLLLLLPPPQDPETWFLKLPALLRAHYSDGRTIKLRPSPDHPEIGVFSIRRGPPAADSPHRVLIVHGAGCSSFSFRRVVDSLAEANVHAAAIDLPGSGFSDRSVAVTQNRDGGKNPLRGMWSVVEDIREKGLFWGFDQLIQQGYVNLPEKTTVINNPIEFNAGRLLEQVIHSMPLPPPIDLVLHDTAFPLLSDWISQNPTTIRSLVLLDSSPNGTALPLWAFQTPLVKEMVMGMGCVFRRAVAGCCVARWESGEEAEAHRVLLKGWDGGRSGMGASSSRSLDLGEWGGRNEQLPVKVIWSEGWSSEGREVAAALPRATLSLHSGGRWVQGRDAAVEVAQRIREFITSLPPPGGAELELELSRSRSQEDVVSQLQDRCEL
ncbi:hypothetical protein M569_11871 [Genlisea aurea]|uniref:AB hydrolase-1 domain-containing protein n=1 Tax=Genlisea aurea TaxID=192259 RepID=S8C7X4_9LAMI|nr:hypothetical protein M569_11871 [Genlisea aurea]